MSDNKDFFKKQTDSSRVKAAIISEYFPQYCHIISRRHTPQRFGYFDMFAGPGIYEDESWSTPLLVAKNCYEDTFLRDKVWMVFKVTRCQARCYVSPLVSKLSWTHFLIVMALKDELQREFYLTLATTERSAQ